MSNNSKKLLGGVVALVAIMTVVNTTAIVELSKSMRGSAQSERVAHVSTQTAPMQEYYVGNQQAAVGTIGTIAEEEFGGMVIVITYDGNNCVVNVIHDDGHSSQYSGSTVYGSNGTTPIGCSTLIPEGTFEIYSSNNQLSINGSSKILVNQFQLYLFGYMTEDQITGKSDVATQNAVKSFQKANGISQTGTVGPLTSAALDKAISSIKGTSVTGTKFTFPR